MTNKHTPGPWKSSHPMTIDATAQRVTQIRVDAETKGVATLSDHRMNEGEAWANARLIAAAPELLAALVVALPILEAFDRQAPAAIQELITARAAIAKATGE